MKKEYYFNRLKHGRDGGLVLAIIGIFLGIVSLIVDSAYYAAIFFVSGTIGFASWIALFFVVKILCKRDVMKEDSLEGSKTTEYIGKKEREELLWECSEIAKNKKNNI